MLTAHNYQLQPSQSVCCVFAWNLKPLRASDSMGRQHKIAIGWMANRLRNWFVVLGKQRVGCFHMQWTIIWLNGNEVISKESIKVRRLEKSRDHHLRRLSLDGGKNELPLAFPCLLLLLFLLLPLLRLATRRYHEVPAGEEFGGLWNLKLWSYDCRILAGISSKVS